MSLLRTIVTSSRALATTAKDVARFREIASVFVAHGFGWVFAQLKLRRELRLDDDTPLEEAPPPRSGSARETGKRLVKVLTELGPMWVKFGQILSTRPDILPEALIAELQTLQDNVEPVAFEEIEEQLQRNLGDDYQSFFSQLDETPLASASIGQVHRATLKSGEKVVLKVQRPGIRPNITRDLHILHTIAGYIEEAFEEAHAMGLQGMVEDFAKSLSQELDYRVEANNIDRFRRNFEDEPRVYFPQVHRELSGLEVLVMEYIEGRKLSTLIEDSSDKPRLVENYFHVAYQMLFVDGFFHGDLHPGNVFVLDDDRLALIDCGMVGHLAPRRKDKVIDILYAVINEDFEGVARTFYSLAIPQGAVDYPAFEADAMAIAERYIIGVPISQVHIGELFSELVAGAAKNRVRMPTDFTMMFKAILTTEGIAKAIAPDVDAVEMAKPFISKMVTERYSPERMRQLAMSDFQVLSSILRDLPRSVPMLLDNLQRGRVSFGIADETLTQQKQAADLRTRRTLRSAFAITFTLCGTFALALENLPQMAWGIPWLSAIFWALAGLWGLTLLYRPPSS